MQISTSVSATQFRRTENGSSQPDGGSLTQKEQPEKAKGVEQLSQDQLRQIQTLKARDQEVRAHEQAHLSAAGSIAISGASFSYTTGPDGQRYATGGEVSIDTSAVANDPQATLAKAETIRRAALAPAQPSAQDHSVASKASAMANKARAELLQAYQDPEQNRKGQQIQATA